MCRTHSHNPTERQVRALHTSSDWIQDVLASFRRGLFVDPSVLIHRSRSQFLDDLSRCVEGLGPIAVLFPVAHLWALARADRERVQRYLFEPQEQLPLLTNHSEPQSLRAAADWIRREPWIHARGGPDLLRKGLTSLRERVWDPEVVGEGNQMSTALAMASCLTREMEARSLPLLTFSGVYARLMSQTKVSIINAPPSLSSGLFRSLNSPPTDAHPRIIIPLSAFHEGRSPFLQVLLEGAQVCFR